MDKKPNEERKALNIYQRINHVMRDVRSVVKEDKKVNGQYRFVSHDAVVAALHMPMVDHGVVIVPTIAELRQDGNRTVVRVDVSFVNVDNPDDRFVISYWGYGIDPQDKGVGKAVSYAVKYALLKTFCLESCDDVERDSIDYTSEKLSNDQIANIIDIIDGDEELASKMLRWQGVNSVEDIRISSYDAVVENIKKYKNKENKDAKRS